MSDWMDELGLGKTAAREAESTTAAAQVSGLSVPVTGKEPTHPVMVRLPEPVYEALTTKLNQQGQKVAPWIRQLIMELTSRPK